MAAIDTKGLLSISSNIKSGKIKSGEGKEKVKDAINDVGDFLKKIFSGNEEKKEERKERRSQRKERRKQRRLIRKERRYQKRGNKIVKVDQEGNETEVTNSTERFEALQEINTPFDRLPERAKQTVERVFDEEETERKINIKPSNQNIILYSVIGLVLIILIYKLLKK